MSDDSQRRTRLGFTLVDVVVATAFCGLLIAIMLPPAQQVRRQAQDMVCMNNLHRQYTAATEYATSNRAYYPRGILGYSEPSGELGEYNVYATALLPYLGWEGTEPLWRSRPPRVKTVLRKTNKILLGFDVFHCPGFPVNYYDDPNDQRYFYTNPVNEELYGPGGVNPLHYASSSFSMPYGQYAIDNDEPDLCWDANGDVLGFAAPAGAEFNAESSTLESFPENCPPETKVYVTGVDKSVPWIYYSTGAGRVLGGIRFYHAFLTSQLGFSSHGRISEDRRHPRGMNSLFFDGHVRPIATDKLDPGCETTLDYRLRYFTVPWDGWDGWGEP